MAKNDMHDKPFDEGTLVKLELFEKYVNEWLPVFLHAAPGESLAIWDFFSGSGCDVDGNPGSPMRILAVLESYLGDIFKTKTSIRILLNDHKRPKIDLLQENLAAQYDELLQRLRDLVSIEYFSEDFLDLFDSQKTEFPKTPNLIFLDQYGVKYVSPAVFEVLIELDRTDFMFFVSSSHLRRFAETPEMQNVHPELDMEGLRSAKHTRAHDFILQYYRNLIPAGNPMRLYAFTIKKGSNIYGLIFGSKHPRGIEKFLDVAWKINPVNGTANFELEEDAKKAQRSLFGDTPLTKRQAFSRRIEEYIQKHGTVTNEDIWHLTLDCGHPAIHARDDIKRRKDAGLVDYDVSMRGFSWTTCVKIKSITQIMMTNHG